MPDLRSLINKNRKVVIGILILVVTFGLLFVVSLFARLRNQQSTNQNTQATTLAPSVISIYSTTPANQETGVPTNTNIIITFNQTVNINDFSFTYNSGLKLKAIQSTTNTFEFQNQSGFKPNQKYEFKITIKNQNLIFNSQTKEYSFTFIAGNYNLKEAIQGSVK